MVLLLILMAAVGFRYLYRRYGSPPAAEQLAEATSRNVRELDSLWQAEDNAAVSRRAGDREAALFPFDPNTADSVTLVSLGLRPWQVRNMMKYRSKGGRWRDAAHFSHLYGLTRIQYERLRPYLRFTRQEMAADVYAQPDSPSRVRADSLRALRIPKLSQGSTVDANTADTALLKQIPGIGSYYARRIAEYRERLGGYVCPGQVSEAHEDLPSDIAGWFTVDASVRIHKLNVNKATFKQLVRHPYLSYEQVREIFRYRQTDGELHGWDDLRLSKVFTPADFKRLDPYIEF